MDARCQCGAVSFKTPISEPLKVFVCHCTRCRHQSSSAFGISAIFPTFDLDVTQLLNTRKFSRTKPTGRTLDCFFCKKCGSRLMHKAKGQMTVAVKGGCLEGLNKEMMSKATHIWTTEAIVRIPEGVEQYEGDPPDDA